MKSTLIISLLFFWATIINGGATTNCGCGNYADGITSFSVEGEHADCCTSSIALAGATDYYVEDNNGDPQLSSTQYASYSTQMQERCCP